MKSSRNKTPSKHNLGLKPKAAIKDSIEVFCRIRPQDQAANDPGCLKLVDNNTVQLLPPEYFRGYGSRETNAVEYTFKQVFDDSITQKEVFQRAAFPLVEDLTSGRNGLIFTYGVTSSGKTYTMTGTPVENGLIPRTLDVLFNTLRDRQAPRHVFKPDGMNNFIFRSTDDVTANEQRQIGAIAPHRTPKLRRQCFSAADWAQRETDNISVTGVDTNSKYSVFVSYVEIYNNHIFDLLEEVSLDQVKDKIQSKILRTDSRNNVYVNGATEVEVKSSDDALEMFLKGLQRRRVAHTALNTESSRSHSVFTLRLVRVPVDSAGKEASNCKEHVNATQLSLVDLAGSERTQRTQNTGNRLKEAGNINNSLMVLRQCIEIMREKQANRGACNKKIPYRDNKLTLLFKGFFEGEGRIRMIVCVHPRIEEYEETLQVMRFAEITQEVVISRPVVNTPKIRLAKGRRELRRQEHVQEDKVAFQHLEAPFQSFNLADFDGDMDAMLVNYEEYLMRRIENRSEMRTVLNGKMRAAILELEKEYTENKEHLNDALVNLETSKYQLQTAESKLSTAERSNFLLRRNLLEINQKKQTPQHHLYEQNPQRLHRVEAVRRKMPYQIQDAFDPDQIQDGFDAAREKAQHVIQQRLLAKQAELQDKLGLTADKFQLLREILKFENCPLNNNLAVPNWMNSPYKVLAQSDSQLNNIDVTPYKGSHHVNIDCRRRKQTPAPEFQVQSKRRSSSADSWLKQSFQHRVETGTVSKWNSGFQLESLTNGDVNASPGSCSAFISSD